MTVAYVTDLEGMWDRLRTFADGNSHVRLDGDRIELAPGVTFVFGGDAIDRGPHGMRIVRVLLEAKRRLGDRVVLIAGNRDLNKMRLGWELRGHPSPRAPRGLGNPDLLRWIFTNTMGAGGAFEHRRTELGGVPDDDVVDSYLDDPDLRAYQAESQLAFRDGATLFVHGGLSDESLGAIPGRDRVTEPDAWIASLNTWYAEQVGELAKGRRPVALMGYQAPTPGSRNNLGSVVYSRTSDALNNPLLPSPRVMERLGAAGIRRVVVGHTPNGDSPSVLRDHAAGFELVFADNSHARHEHGSRLVVEGDTLSIDARTEIDHDAALHRLRFVLRLGEASPIGLRFGNRGQLIKGRLEGGDYVAFRYLPGYETEQVAVTAREIEQHALAPAAS